MGVGVPSWVLVDFRQCGSNRRPSLLHTYSEEGELLALAHFYSDSEIPKRYYWQRERERKIEREGRVKEREEREREREKPNIRLPCLSA